MKKYQLAVKLCRAVGVEREKPKLPFLDWREMLYVLSWIILAEDVKNEVEARLVAATREKRKKYKLKDYTPNGKRKRR